MRDPFTNGNDTAPPDPFVKLEGIIEAFSSTQDDRLRATWHFVLGAANGSKVSIRVGPARRLHGTLSNGERVRVLGRRNGDGVDAFDVFSRTQRRPVGPARAFIGEDLVAGVGVFVAISAIGLLPVAGVYLLRVFDWQLAALVVVLLGFVLSIALAFLVLHTAQESLDIGFAELESDLAQFAAAALLLVVMFAVAAQQLHLMYPTQFGVGRSGGGDLWTWGMFALDNLAECIALDIPSIFDLHLADTSPTGTAGRCLVLAFRLGIDFIVITSFVRYARFLRRHTLPR